jgi:hypothetical protein
MIDSSHGNDVRCGCAPVQLRRLHRRYLGISRALGQGVDAVDPLRDQYQDLVDAVAVRVWRLELDGFLAASSAGRPTQPNQDGGGPDEQAGGWRDDAGRREPTTHDLVVLASHTCRVRRLVHLRHDLAHAYAASADKVAVYPRAGVTGDGSLERICTARDPSDPAAPMTPIVFKGGIGPRNVARLCNAGVHMIESTGSWAHFSPNSTRPFACSSAFRPPVRLLAPRARRLPIARPDWFHRVGSAPKLVTAGPPPRVVRVRAADTFGGDGGWHGVDEGDRRGG